MGWEVGGSHPIQGSKAKQLTPWLVFPVANEWQEQEQGPSAWRRLGRFSSPMSVDLLAPIQFGSSFLELSKDLKLVQIEEVEILEDFYSSQRAMIQSIVQEAKPRNS